MDFVNVAAALVSAMLHAGWNAAVKTAERPKDVMTAQMLLGAILVIPALAWTGLPAPASWIWIAASTSINMVTLTALLRAYALIGFGMVYPVVRALSVLCVVPLAAALSGDELSPFGLAGIGLIVASLLTLGFGDFRHGKMPKKALGYIALAGFGTAAYVLCDAQGVRRAGSPLAYGFTASIANALLMAWLQNALHRPWRIIRDNAGRAVPIAIVSMVSYLLILWVWSRAPIAPAAALRDTSAVFALIISVVWLREPFTKVRLAAIVLAAVAVPLLRLA
jgi:drug/metabolite transporter (DMT)-like permease